MVAKKSSKTVLEYDPLAWLKEEDSSEKPQKKAAGRNKVVKKAVAKKSASKNVESAAEVERKEPVAIENVNFGFFNSEDEVVEIMAMPTDSGATIISIGSSLTIKTIAELKQQLDESLAENVDITLDSAELQKIDTAGLQLLFSLQNSLQHTGQQLLWANKNPMIESAAKLIGLSELIGDAESQGFGFFEDESVDPKQDQGFGFF